MKNKSVIFSVLLLYTLSSASDFVNISAGTGFGNFSDSSLDTSIPISLQAKINTLNFLNIEKFLVDVRIGVELPLNSSNVKRSDIGLGIGYNFNAFTAEAFIEHSNITIDDSISDTSITYGGEIELDLYTKDMGRQYSFIYHKDFRQSFTIGAGARYKHGNYSFNTNSIRETNYSTIIGYLYIKTSSN